MKRKRKIIGTIERPRMFVRISNSHVYASLVDDTQGKTLASASSMAFKGKKSKKNIEAAKEVGKTIAEAAQKKGHKKIVFDRGKRLYRGKVKALADTLREAGMEF